MSDNNAKQIIVDVCRATSHEYEYYTCTRCGHNDFVDFLRRQLKAHIGSTVTPSTLTQISAQAKAALDQKILNGEIDTYANLKVTEVSPGQIDIKFDVKVPGDYAFTTIKLDDPI